MRLVTPLRAPFAAPIAPSHRGGLIQQPSSATAVHSVPARDLEIQPAFASTVADAKENLAPPLSRVGPLPMPMVVGRHEYVIKIRCSLPPPLVTVAPGHEGVDAYHALCVVAMQNAGRRSLQQRPCGRRSTVAARPSRTLASGDQTRYCTGVAPLVADPSALALHTRHDRSRGAPHSACLIRRRRAARRFRAVEPAEPPRRCVAVEAAPAAVSRVGCRGKESSLSHS